MNLRTGLGSRRFLGLACLVRGGMGWFPSRHICRFGHRMCIGLYIRMGKSLPASRSSRLLFHLHHLIVYQRRGLLCHIPSLCILLVLDSTLEVHKNKNPPANRSSILLHGQHRRTRRVYIQARYRVSNRCILLGLALVLARQSLLGILSSR